MPVYEYSCLKCGRDFELLIRGDVRAACPDCETTRVERRMSLPARPGGGKSPDFSKLGPPGGGCGGGSCGCH